jgi:hypothetical protein
MKIALEDRIEEFQDRVIADRNMATLTNKIPGWGTQADPENDPTYPMKHYNGADHERNNYEKAPQQPLDIEMLQTIERPGITRVFGTSTPPSGLSGAIRRFAFKYSEATAAHWMSLVLADRVNVVEGKIDDIKNGVVPNPWIERGWKAEWKHNRTAFVGKAATTALLITAGIMLLSKKKSSKRSFAKG